MLLVIFHAIGWFSLNPFVSYNEFWNLNMIPNVEILVTSVMAWWERAAMCFNFINLLSHLTSNYCFIE